MTVKLGDISVSRYQPNTYDKEEPEFLKDADDSVWTEEDEEVSLAEMEALVEKGKSNRTVDHMTDETMSAYLQQTRKTLKATKKTMAEWLNVPYNTYTAWERNEIRIRHKTIMSLAMVSLILLHRGSNEKSVRDDRTCHKPR